MVFFLKIKKKLEEKNLWQMLSYLFFGGLTTVVNIMVYLLFVEGFSVNYLVANAISWIVSVIFAFITNKIWVFHSKTETFSELSQEFLKFIFYRGVSFLLDMGTMYLFVSLLSMGDFWAKIITQVLVVVANYVFSKFLIFERNDLRKE